MKAKIEAKYAETYRVGYLIGYKKGLEVAIASFQMMCKNNDWDFNPQEFYLTMEELKEDLDIE